MVRGPPGKVNWAHFDEQTDYRKCAVFDPEALYARPPRETKPPTLNPVFVALCPQAFRCRGKLFGGGPPLECEGWGEE